MEELEGTWISPRGVRMEVARSADGWDVSLFLDRRGRIKGGGGTITDETELREKIRKFEDDDGYARITDPTDTGPRAPMESSQLAGIALVGVGVVILVVVVLAVFS